MYSYALLNESSERNAWLFVIEKLPVFSKVINMSKEELYDYIVPKYMGYKNALEYHLERQHKWDYSEQRGRFFRLFVRKIFARGLSDIHKTLNT